MSVLRDECSSAVAFPWFFGSDGGITELDLNKLGPTLIFRRQSGVSAIFLKADQQAATREAQDDVPGDTYSGFRQKVKAACCAGYIVSFLGLGAVYLSRTDQTHVKIFP